MTDKLPFNVELLARALDILPYKYYIVDRDLNIAFWNKRGEEGPYGVKQEEAIGKRLESVLKIHRPDVVSPKPIDSMTAEFREVFDTGIVLRAEEISQLRNGEKRHYKITKTPIRAEDGTISHAAVIIEDVTAQRRLESMLLAKERLFTLEHMAAGIAHQLNNPLSTLMVCLESLLKETEKNRIADPEVAERFASYLGISIRQIEKCKDVARILANAGKTEAGGRSATDIKRVLEETVSILRSSKRFINANFEMTFSPGIPNAVTNETLLRQAFVSLLVNALEAVEGKENGTIIISACAQDSGGKREIAVTINDNGGGIPREHLNRIYAPFFTTKGSANAGLGLTVSHEIISWHGGSLKVESEEGRGCLVTVCLPVHAEERDA